MGCLKTHFICKNCETSSGEHDKCDMVKHELRVESLKARVEI